MSNLSDCPECEGDGEINYHCSCRGMSFAFDCNKCGDSGIDGCPCPTCGGTGEVTPDILEDWEENHKEDAV